MHPLPYIRPPSERRRALILRSSWLEQSRQQGNPLVERPLASSWPPRLLANQLLLQEVSRSPIVTGLVLLPFVKFVVTRRALSSSSGSCLSSAWYVRLPRTSRPIFVSSPLQSWPFRRHLRLTSLVSLKILTCAPSMPRESPLCQRTSS